MSEGGGHGKRRGHEEEHEEHENHERWLVSYADMMTLLMVLFIVMFAISQVDAKKFMALKTGLASGFGAPVAFVDGADHLLELGSQIGREQENLAGAANKDKTDPEAAAANGLVNPQKVAELVDATEKAQIKGEVENLKKAEAELRKALQVAGLLKGATFRFDERGLVVSVAADKVLFESGSATLRPDGRRILDAIAPTLLKLPNRLSIDGHTDSNPISSSRFPSNWELASARADGVLRYLGATHRVPYRRMVGSSFADTVPVAKGNSAKALATNRRVEIVVLARIDNAAGRAIEELGNAKPTPKPTPAPSSTPHATTEKAEGAGSSAGADHEDTTSEDTTSEDTTSEETDDEETTSEETDDEPAAEESDDH